jgi:hypothetical protein
MKTFQDEWASLLRIPPPFPFEALEEKITSLISPSCRLSEKERFKIYHDQVWNRFTDILQKQYPSLVRFLGISIFHERIAYPFLQTYWPKDWPFVDLGKELPGWICRTYTNEDQPYLLGLAAVDWGYHKLHDQKYVLLHLESDFFHLRENLLQSPSLPILSRTKKWHLIQQSGWKPISSFSALIYSVLAFFHNRKRKLVAIKTRNMRSLFKMSTIKVFLKLALGIEL